jgi:hypothetical protein
MKMEDEVLQEKLREIFAPDPGFFARMRTLVHGICQPKSTLDYKRARIELQRLSAFGAALLLPLIVAVLLCVMAGGRGAKVDDSFAVEVITPEEMLDLVKEELPPPEEPRQEPTMDVELPGVENPSAHAANDPAPVQPMNSLPSLTDASVLRTVSPVVFRGISSRGGKGTSGSIGFGSGTRQDGDLVGALYDLKRDSNGNPRKYNYFADAKYIVDGRLGKKSFAPFHKVGKSVYLSHLFIPVAPAEAAPKIFSVEGLMEPRGWIAHYTGQVQPQESGRYRFVGQFDDYISVMIDGKVVLEATWDSGCKNGVQTVSGWEPKVNRWKYRAQAPNQYLTFGDWIDLSSAKPRRIDILCGENPGGLVSGILLIEHEGATYQTASDGRPILPPFTTGMLSLPERERIKSSGYAFDTHAIPIMNTQGRTIYAANGTDSADIKVDSGDL